MTGNLTETIARYRAGLVEYNSSDEASPAATFEPVLKELEEWGAPATTLAEAVEALRVANGEVRNFDGGRLVAAMVQTAFGYFDGVNISAVPPSEQLINIEDEINAAKYRIMAIGLMAEGLRLRGVSDAITAVALDARERLESAADHLDQFRETAGAA